MPSFKTSLAWVEVCNEKHDFCRKYRRHADMFSLPTRVIDVGPSDSSIDPFLFVSKGHKAHYICLSHCWGGTTSTLIQSTKENLETWKDRIPLSVLPNTFLDAVKFTRAMNIRYLWIDSLCIIQNDAHDWQYEAASMASIYKNSYLTIAAAASKDPFMGCFRPRKTFALLGDPVSETVESSNQSEPYLFYPDSESTIYSLAENPLNSRGWTFQEMSLPCRTISFCEDQLLWQCLERISTEDGVIDCHPRSIEEDDYTPKVRTILGARLGLMEEFANIESQRLFWWSMVMEYTTRSTTELKDRLPALSGVIAAFQERTGSTPIAGLWKNDLPYGLLWQCASRNMRTPQELSLVPTWSWVALEGPIRNHLTLHSELGTLFGNERRSSIEIVAVIKTAEVYHSSFIPTSPIIGGELSIYGRLQEATRSVEDKDFAMVNPIRDHEISYFRLLALPPSGSREDGSRHIGYCMFDLEAPNPNRTLWCLEVSISDRESDCRMATRANGLEWGRSLDPFENVPAPARTHDVLILDLQEESAEKFRRIGVGVIHANNGAFQSDQRLVTIV